MVFLAPHLTDENVDELIAAASHRSKAEIELLLAHRSPRPDVPTLVQPLDPQRQLVPELMDPHVCSSARPADTARR